MRISVTRSALLCAVSLCAVVSTGEIAAEGAKSVVERLNAKDFWQTAIAPKEESWSADDAAALRALQKNSAEDAVRLRANQVLVELAGHGRFREKEEGSKIARAAFEYLEANLAQPRVRQLCVLTGFTHYTVSAGGPGETWFLIEKVEAKASGGLNLKWDAAQQTFGQVDAWGIIK